ncbi:putative heteroproteinous nuclear ribonucleoprotein [Hibiscus syriacus]|uniref:Heteroproteinous nuclear ribonucleoprotein n=1 Tax=Hibiscus syriacus TaxID=106335 RepID=A0A6A2Y306_HIBSY|nr:putative heteroproteinous nuclear ribonucleoprotein [Hibiscus syriacus]
MAPTGRRTSRKTSKPRRSRHQRKLDKPSIQKTSILLEDLPSNSSTMSSDNLSTKGVDDHISPCSTPKAPRFRIPKVETCPLAPKKQRVLSNCSLQ